jgi:hypothetical protein
MKALNAMGYRLVPCAVLFALAACGPPEKQYEKKPAYSGKAANVPAVPNIPDLKRKDGDAWTVSGIAHDLRSIVHHEEVEGKKETIVGYIVKTNMVPCKDKKTMDGGLEQCVPECAVHKTGKADPDGCKAPIPTFWIADKKGDTTSDMIQVMGWASNFANIHDAIEEWDKQDPKKRDDKAWLSDKLTDKMTNAVIPFPLPVVDMKVKVSGDYGSTFSSASGFAADPNHGILHFESVEYVEQGTTLANLPTMPDRKKDDKK